MYDSTSQHQNSADLLQGNASSNCTELLRTCLGPKRYFYIAVVNSCSCLCLKILGNKLIHFYTLFQPAQLMPAHIFRGLILDSFILNVQPQRRSSRKGVCCSHPCGRTLLQDRFSLRLSNPGLLTLPHRTFTKMHFPNRSAPLHILESSPPTKRLKHALGYKLSCLCLQSLPSKNLLAKETISACHWLLDQLCGFTWAKEFQQLPLILNFRETLDKLIC